MKKRLIFCLNIFLFIGILYPICTNASENNKEQTKILTCKYEYQTTNGVTKELIYNIYSNNKLSLPFEDGKNFSNINMPWYHGEDFKSVFLKNSKINSQTYVCPSITIEEDSSFITVFNNPKDKCNGNCTTISAKEIVVSKNAKSDGVIAKKVISTEIASSVGIYQSTKYFLPYFRLLDDGTKEWSLNGKNYISVDKNFTIKTPDNTVTTIKLNDDLLNSIYSNNQLNSNITIYRCVTQKNGNYTYLLSLNEDSCPINDLSKKDNQGEKSSSYNGSLGTKSDEEMTQDDLKEWLEDYDQEQTCEGSASLLGDPTDEDSVAWLLQTILNYIRIIGPMIVVVMSGMDFAKAIIQSDDENMAKSYKRLGIRLLLAASLFFLPKLVTVLLTIFGIMGDPTCGLQ